MRLVDLGARFIRHEEREPHEEARRLSPAAKIAHWIVTAERFEDAHGVEFDCPAMRALHGKGHAHRIRLWFFGKPVGREIGMNRVGEIVRFRVVSGSTLETITLAPSVRVEDDACGQWSGSIMSGEAATFERPGSKEKPVKKRN